MSLHPPGLALRAEIGLRPGVEKDGARFINFDVGKSKGKGGRSTYNSSGGCVLIVSERL